MSKIDLLGHEDRESLLEAIRGSLLRKDSHIVTKWFPGYTVSYFGRLYVTGYALRIFPELRVPECGCCEDLEKE